MATTRNKTVLKATDRKLPGFGKNEDKWTEPFYFIQAADTQFGMIQTYCEHNPVPGCEKEIALTKLAVEKVNKLKPKPKFFIICGDMLDAFPETAAELHKAQEADFMKVFAELNSDIPLVCVCGNHDIGNTPTLATVQSYRASFGDDYFSFWCGGVHFLVLNSQFYEDSSKVPELAAEHERWLESQLSLPGFKYLVIFQHIPWFLHDPEEEKEYFNIDVELRRKMLHKFQKAGVKSIFCGHYHRNAGGVLGNLELVVTSAVGARLGSDPHGLRIVRVLEDDIKHKYYALDDIPESVEL